ncbi:MAG: hypothetical protein DVB28_000082, partial [Verrucomicrobia bacterium]
KGLRAKSGEFHLAPEGGKDLIDGGDAPLGVFVADGFEILGVAGKQGAIGKGKESKQERGVFHEPVS